MASADLEVSCKILPQTEWCHEYDRAAFLQIQSFLEQRSRQAPGVAVHIQDAWFRPGHGYGGRGGRKRECGNEHGPKNILSDERRGDSGSTIVGRRDDFIGMTQPLTQLGFKL